MLRRLRLLLLLLNVCALAHADPRTVCTITVNSADEGEAFRRHLPVADYRFVELVERGRVDWLASACRKQIRCDVLLISGHFDGGDVFYTDRFDRGESLPTDELDRASCSDACPGVFSQLKEVYLFGCNTLDPRAIRSVSPDMVRALVRSGHEPAEAEQLAAGLAATHAESNRDRMRRIFHDVPVIYGFSSKAPLGRNAAPLLERFFESAPDVGSGRANAKLLGLFAPASMTVASGATELDPDAAFRRDVCRFYDDRASPAEKAEFVHGLLGRDMAEVRLFLDRIEAYAATVDGLAARSPQAADALRAIARDTAARGRFLEFARDADEPSVRARMIAIAGRLGWLTGDERRAEIVRMIGEWLAQERVGAAEVDLACSMNRDGALDADAGMLSARIASAGNAAALACLGNASARGRVLDALTSTNEDDVAIAQVYLRHRPLADPGELHALAGGIARMTTPASQARALETLAPQRLTDRDTLTAFAALFRTVRSLDVQRAIAGILVRGDYATIASPELVRTLRQSRMKSPNGDDVIDVLIRRLQAVGS